MPLIYAVYYATYSDFNYKVLLIRFAYVWDSVNSMAGWNEKKQNPMCSLVLSSGATYYAGLNVIWNNPNPKSPWRTEKSWMPNILSMHTVPSSLLQLSGVFHLAGSDAKHEKKK